MKKSFSRIKRGAALSLAAILLLLSCACGKGGETGKESGNGSDSAAGTAGVTGPVEIPDLERHIHAISELNTTVYPLDSAAGEEQNSTLMRNYRESYKLPKEQMADIEAYYPRIKVLPDGSFFMIFHNKLHGNTVYGVLSQDGVTWGEPYAIFSPQKLTFDGVSEKRIYMTPDACVLSDGRLLAVTSYRSNKNYKTEIDRNGVAIKLSEDGGKTWGEEQIVYVGTNWEPSALEADNGEILIFFSCTAPSVYQLGVDKFEYRSSGVGCVRSKDGGKTWTPNVTGAPYLPQYVMRQKVSNFSGTSIMRYTDQMPVAIQLNNGTIALAAESALKDGGNYRFSICYTDDYFAEDVGMEKTGPANRQSNLFDLAGPYLSQFDSGEVLLTNHWGTTFRYRLGDCTAHTFYSDKTLYPEAGMWGSCEKVTSHSAVITVATEEFEIMVSRMYLNHRLHAHKITPSMYADPAEWENSTDALFCGSNSQAQVSLRVGYDDDNIYLLAERLDKQITGDDAISIYIDDGTESGYFRMTVGNEGIVSMDHKPKNSVQGEPVDLAAEGVRATVWVDGTVDSDTDEDNGVIYEIALPRTLLKVEGNLRFIFDLVNCDKAGDIALTEAAQPDASFRNKSNWFTASFE